MQMREICSLSKLEVAKALGMHASTLLRWENGERLPKPADLAALAAIYQVEVDWLQGRVEGDLPQPSLDRRDRAKAIMYRMRALEPDAPTLGKSNENWYLLRAKRFDRDIKRRRALSETPEAMVLHDFMARLRPVMLAQHYLPTIPGISKEVILAIRCGLVVPSTDLLAELAKGMGVNARWLLCGEEGGGLATGGEDGANPEGA